jgi:hypothetical protein
LVVLFIAHFVGLQEMKIPTTIPTVSFARVLRDATWHNHPSGLLVEGDVIQLALGDAAPCRVRLLDKLETGWTPQPLTMEKDVVLTPSLMETEMGGLRLAADGLYHFMVLDTPITKTLEAALNIRRPDTVIARQLQILGQFYLRYTLWIMPLASFIVNLACFLANGSTTDGSRWRQGVSTLSCHYCLYQSGP